MEYSFLELIAMLNEGLRDDNFAFRLARNANLTGDYLFSKLLPRENRNDWQTTGGSLTITPTILGDVAMDSDPAPMGNMQASSFFENISKFGGQMFFNEKQQRELIMWENNIRIEAGRNGLSGSGDIDGQFRSLADTGRADNTTVNGRRINTLLAIVESVKKSNWDTGEWLCGEAFTEGEIVYNFSGLEMNIDYRIPAANIKTYAGNDRFDQSTSKWWEFVRFCYSTLENPRFYMNQNSYLDVVDNDVNGIREIDITGKVRRLERYRSDAITQKNDARERMSVEVYNKAGSIMNPATKSLVSKPFLKDKRVVVVGELNTSEIELTLGGMTDPDNELRMGYQHIGPTIEGGGRPGIYANIYALPQKPQQLFVDTYTNMLPVIANPKKIIIAKFA
jgi:hypothetical protein